MLKTISEDAILFHLSISPMTAAELAGDLHVEPMAMAGMLVELARRGTIRQHRSARADVGLVYSLPGYCEPKVKPNFAEVRTARDYGMIYSGGYGYGD